MDIHAEQDAKNKTNEAIVNDLIRVNEKLRNGEVVDQNEAIRLIMGGIIALISKNAGIDDQLEARIVDLEVEKNTAKSRLQNLESWVLKQEENLKDLNKKVVENYETIKKEMRENIDTSEEPKGKQKQVIKCNVCKKSFARNCDLEIHMNEHGTDKMFKCNICGKTFHLEWRQKKHEKNHNTETHVKPCRYFSNQEPCPYEAIGCKFLHDPSIICRNQDCENLLCPFAHQNVTNSEGKEDNIEDVSDQEQEETLDVNENQCHLCLVQFESKDDVFNHVQANHDDYFRGMMEFVNQGVS